MQTIYLGFFRDNTSDIMHGFGIRTSYLLSNQVRLAGNLDYYFTFREWLGNFSLEKKIEFAQLNDKELSEAQREEFREMRKDLKEIRKIKNKPKELIVLIKRTENSIIKYFDAVVEVVAKNFNKTGIPRLKQLEDKPGFDFYYMQYPDSEDIQNKEVALSDLLLFKPNEDDFKNPTFFFLNSNFSDFRLASDHGAVIPRENKFTDDGFIVPLLKLYNINRLLLSEIDAIRLHLGSALTVFQEAADCFVNLKSDPKQAFKYLQNELKASADHLQAAFTENPVILNFKDKPGFKEYLFEISFGMLPWHTIYKYFKFTKTIEEKTAAVLEKQTPPAGLVPVMILKHLEKSEYFNKIKAEEKAAPLTVKKSLTI